jgi:hypothetical protein
MWQSCAPHHCSTRPITLLIDRRFAMSEAVQLAGDDAAELTLKVQRGDGMVLLA